MNAHRVVMVVLLAVAPARAAPLIPVPPDVPVQYIAATNAAVFHARHAAVFIDVRGQTAYDAEHITGALAVSLPDLRAGKAPPLPKSAMIVTYCDCPHAMAEEGAKYLTAAGYPQVYVLDEGFGFWRDHGYPVTAAAKKSTKLRRIELRGAAVGLPPGTRVYAHHAATDQWEAGQITAGGAFTLHVPLYGVSGPVQLDVFAGSRHGRVRVGAGDRRAEIRLN